MEICAAVHVWELVHAVLVPAAGTATFGIQNVGALRILANRIIATMMQTVDTAGT